MHQPKLKSLLAAADRYQSRTSCSHAHDVEVMGEPEPAAGRMQQDHADPNGWKQSSSAKRPRKRVS
jgi:hypothetical protein